MTGLERNADVVVMCSYAPLFAHHEGWQWTPDLIWFDNLKAYGTANYYVQKLFSNNRGTHVLSILQNNEPLAGKDSLFASAAFDKQTGEVILKLVNASSTTKKPEIVLKTNHKIQSKAVNFQLYNSDPDAMNSLENSTAIAPVSAEVAVRGQKIMPELPAFSFSVVRIKIQ